MADIGDELSAGCLRGLDAGDVVENDQRAPGGQWGGIDLEDAAGSEQAGAAHAELVPLERAAHTGQQLGVADGVDEGAAGNELRAGDALHDSVGPAHEARGGDGDDSLLHGVKHDG